MNNILDEFNILSEDAYIDNVGGYHDSGIGWNPHGHWCGECTNATCQDCPSRYVLDYDEDN